MQKKFSLLLSIGGMAISSLALAGCVGNRAKSDKYTKDGKLIIDIKNLYFDNWAKGDVYTDEIEKKFGVSFNVGGYSWSNWATQVNGDVAADNVTDVFHANIDSYNFVSYYKYWAEEEIAKPLPDDLSKWPHLQEMIENTTNVEKLKLNGHLYGIPIAKNTTDYETTFSPFTYVYRRDWAKKYGVYQENDEYTWAQFENLLKVFQEEGAKKSTFFALGDVEWGYPSITNFYKQVPHCFAQDETGKYVNNYTTNAYITGLEKSKEFEIKNFYGYPQYSAVDGDLNKEYYGNRCGVFYENLSYSNYATLRNKLVESNIYTPSFNIDDATAIMKIKGEDNKYVLEGTDNWFSMSFLDFRMSENKMNKILDIIDWLLSEEGTKFSVYGIEGYDYTEEGGEIKLIEKNWPKDDQGHYTIKMNGGRYLRYMASLGYDTLDYDPLTDMTALSILNSWDAEMKEALADGELKVLKETPEVMWLTTPLKSQYSGQLRESALDNVVKYIENDIRTIDDFKRSVSGSTWDKVLAEINQALGK